MSSIPDATGPAWLPVSDKVVHACLYAVLGAALAYGRARGGQRTSHGWLVALGLLYGISDEWHQAFVPGRTPDVFDWLADVIGVLTGYGTTWGLLGRTKDDQTEPPAPTTTAETHR